MQRSRHMWGECLEMQKKFKKMKGKKTRAMVATWSDEESDDSTSFQEEDKDNFCLMTHGNEVEEVNIEEEESFSIDQWELADSVLLEKYRKMKHDNKCLKRF